MDQTAVDLILSRLDEVREDYKDNQAKLDKIAGCIVGQDRCVQNMEKLTARIEGIENDFEPRIRCLENQQIIVDYQKGLVGLGWKAVTSSPVLGAIMALLAAIAAAVYWPGISDLIARWGLHITLALLAFIATLLFLTWKGRKRIADAGKGWVWFV